MKTRDRRKVVGIDVSKTNADHGVGKKARAQRSVVTDAAGLAALAEELARGNVQLVAMEATGGYEQPVLKALAAAKVKVALLQPERVMHFARSQGTRANRRPRLRGYRELRGDERCAGLGGAERGSRGGNGTRTSSRRAHQGLNAGEKPPSDGDGRACSRVDSDPHRVPHQAGARRREAAPEAHQVGAAERGAIRAAEVGPWRWCFDGC